MNMVAKSKAAKFPKIRKSFEEMERLLEDCPIQILYYYDFPNIVFCYCEVCKQSYPYDKRYLLSRKTCPVCTHRKVIAGYNDIATLRPDLVKYLKNPKDAFKYFPFSNKPIECVCPVCLHEKKMLLTNLSKQGLGCFYCSNSPNRVIVGKNDIATKAPWMIQYLADKTDATRYTWKSNQKIWFKCPTCKKNSKKPVYSVSNEGYFCKYCADGISYPNKFARAFFEQLPVKNLEFEFKRTWTQGRFYDCYFEYNSKKYFVEMDGGMHYGKSGLVSLEEAQRIDSIKDAIAYKNNVNMVRIDCRKSDLIYISQNIKKSIIGQLFDLSNVDWNKCAIMANTNIFLAICEEYNRNKLTLYELAEMFHLSYSTMKIYIRRGRSLGVCNNELHPTSRDNMLAKQNSEPIGEVTDIKGNVLFSFVDFVDAAEKLRKINPLVVTTYKSLWWSATRSNNQIYKKQYCIKLFKKGKENYGNEKVS